MTREMSKRLGNASPRICRLDARSCARAARLPAGSTVPGIRWLAAVRRGDILGGRILGRHSPGVCWPDAVCRRVAVLGVWALLAGLPLAAGAQAVESPEATQAKPAPEAPSAAAALAPEQSAAAPEQSAVPGGIHRFALPAGMVSARYQGKPLLIYRNQVFLGIPMDAASGEHRAELTGPEGQRSHLFQVAPKQYPEQRLTIKNQRMVDPLKEDLIRIQEETRRQLAQYQRFTRRLLNLSPFAQPVAGEISSPFGRRRILNGQPRSPHSGLDIAAPVGTPIQAPAPGLVSMTGDLFFNGKTLFLDHGQGLITMYCHLSRIDVAEGQEVQRGETLGQVGATGRATGPHLHWSVSLNGHRVDPVLAMRAFGSP